VLALLAQLHALPTLAVLEISPARFSGFRHASPERSLIPVKAFAITDEKLTSTSPARQKHMSSSLTWT
jgi:hypothetical protein